MLSLSLVVGFVAAVSESSPSRPKGATPEESAKQRITVYQVWASDEGREASSKEIEEFLDLLKKTSKKKHFRLEGKPLTETLEPGKGLTIKLPGGYEGRWTLDKDKEGKPAVRQTLTNPQKKEAVDLLKKTTITSLEKIQNGKETFVLIVQFERTK